MAVTDTTLDALDLNKLKLPPSPKVIRLEVEDFTDMDGEPGLRILAVIDEDTDIEQVRGRDVTRMKMAIHDSLLQHGIDLFPLVFIAKPSELNEDHDEE
jgi:hypothetical protein